MALLVGDHTVRTHFHKAPCSNELLLSMMHAQTQQLPTHLHDDFCRGCAQEICNELQLVHHIPAWKQWLAQQHLRKDAANAPHVDSRRVLCKERATELRGAVPACSHIVCPEHSCGHIVEGGTRKPKITDFEFTVAVGKDVFGLEISVEYTSCRYGRAHTTFAQVTTTAGRKHALLTRLTRKRA